jgi:hypothetical protein
MERRVGGAQSDGKKEGALGAADGGGTRLIGAWPRWQRFMQRAGGVGQGRERATDRWPP